MGPARSSSFVPLTVRSHYSLMWGTASVPEVCAHARRLGYTSLALTDTDNLYGLWPFLTACARNGLRPVVGAEVTDPGGRRRAVCLVADETGYANLCRLLTRRHMDEGFDLAADLPPLSRGLVVLTGHADLLIRWRELGVDAVASMPRRPLPPGHRLRVAAQRLKLPLVAVPGSFFLSPEDHRLHGLLRAIDGNTAVSRLSPADVAPVDAWLAGPEVYARRFAITPDAVTAAAALAERLTFRGPRFGLVMPPWQNGRGRDAAGCLRRAAYAGARRRYGAELAEPVVERLEYELGIIARMGFAAYFMTVRDIVAHSPRTCGRGSGAASLVAYCLGVTNVCPIKHNLYFGRFLNPGRSDPPDIDVDFAWDERDGVIDAVLAKYGAHAAMVSSHILFQPRMAVRETAKVFGLTGAEIGRVTKRLPWFLRSRAALADVSADPRRRPGARDLDFAAPWPRILGLAQRLIGLPRCLSVHPGGVVITPGPVCDYAPVQRAAKGTPIIQWEKEAAEAAGLVKIDLLGNRSLGVIRDALAELRDQGAGFDENGWEPEDDEKTQRMVAAGDTMGCFYIESPAMRLLQQKAGVGDFEHLVIHSSIIRPAANDCIQAYLSRLHGGAWDPIHPLLADVLDETFGIMVYQEDVSRAAMALAGFSTVEADGLRKILSKKDKERDLRDYHGRFVAGARRNGVSDDHIQAAWDMMMSFSGYSFCKPHSASYARVSFQAAYLKAHYPAEFMAAVISNQGGFYSTFAYVSEARRLGVTLLPPDVNRSRARWRGRRGVARVGLMAVKGLSGQTLSRIIACRDRRLFQGVLDFIERARPDEDEVRALIHCGALDSLNPGADRVQLRWQAARRCGRRRKDGDQAQLFDPPIDPQPPPLPPDDDRERLRREFAVLGFLCDRHPMTLFADQMDRAGVIKAAVLNDHVGRRVRLAGWLITGKVVRTRRGDAMEFLTFEDETGVVETTFFPQIHDRFCHLLDYGRPYLLDGLVEENFGAATLTVERVRPMGPA